jgi:hypothetical protein
VLLTDAAATSTSPAWLPVAGVVAGAVVSGIVAIVLAGIQRKSLNDQAERQRAAQREQFDAQARQELRKWRLDARRDRYADYLVATEAFLEATAPVSEVFDKTWPRKDDGVSGAEREQFDAILAQLQECYGSALRHGQLVRLSGPSRITPPIDKALRAMTSARDAAVEGFAAVKLNFDPGDLDTWFGGLRELRTAIEEFISQASVILEGEGVT